MLKKTTLFFLGLATYGTALANNHPSVPTQSCTTNNISASCENQNWDFGIQALYLTPVNNANLGYALNTNSHHFHDLDPNWRWGYQLQGSYHYLTGSDVSINWSHYNSNQHRYGLSTRFNQADPDLVNSNEHLSLNNQFDQINLVLGQQVDMGLLKNARFYGGLQYARILGDTTHVYSNLPLLIQTTPDKIRTTNHSNFNGIGPVIGIDYSYGLPHGLSITANTAGSVLYGSSHYHVVTPYNRGFIIPSSYATKKTMVSSLEAKLGANYAYEMSQGILNLEGGYQVINYFNALQIRPIGFSLVNSDFGLYGPYFGLKWLANA